MKGPVVYQSDAYARFSWRIAGISLLITLLVFMFLPMLETLINQGKKYRLRQIDTVTIARQPPRMPPRQRPQRQQPKPKLKQKPRLLNISQIQAALNVSAGEGDFALDFGLNHMGDAAGLVFEISEVDQTPKATMQVEPMYPMAARLKRIEGEVTLEFVVLADGSVSTVRVVRSTPAGVFDKAAVAAVSKWRFAPGTRHGSPVATRVVLPLTFSLSHK